MHLIKLLFILCAAQFFIFANLSGQTSYLRLIGEVKNQVNGEALVGATIYLPQTAEGAITDNYGKYSLVVKKTKDLQLQISYVGYQPIDTTILLEGSVLRIDFGLKTQSLQTFEVRSKTGSLQHNINQIPVDRLKAIPMLLGQPDVIKALAFLPGVSTGVEGTTGLYVRGGTPDQNLMLLDGATVYNASHLFGFQSVFDPSAIKDIKLIKGGFPARYGGRLSSIIDITMKEGNNQQKQGEFTLGLVNSGLLLEGPIKKGTSSYMVSARAAYLGLLLLPTALGWKQKNDKPFNTLLSYDVNVKVNHQFKNKDKLFASAYLGRDNYLTRFRQDSTYFGTNLRWGNATASLRYLHDFGNGLQSQSMATINEYKSEEVESQTLISTKETTRFLRRSEIRDLAFKQFFHYNASPKLGVSFGTELISQYFRPGNFLLSSNEFNLDSLSQQNQTYRPFNYALYAEGEWDPMKWLKINAGIRRSNYHVDHKNRSYWEPRLNIDLKQGRLSYNLSYSITTQFVHLLTNNSLGLFSDLWVPSTKQVAPQRAEQYSGGIIYKTPSLRWEFSLEGYYKTLSNQIDYRQGVDFFNVSNYNWENAIEKNGQGRAKGIELMIKRETEKFNAWIAYTLSKNERQFTNINSGNWYPYRYDRRHNFNISMVKKLKRDWTLGLNFVYQTGSWVTLASARYVDNSINDQVNISVYPNQTNPLYHLKPIIESRNNQRLPDYHRLDLSVTKNFLSKKRHLPSSFTLSLYNAYGRANPYEINQSLGVTGINKKVETFYFVSSRALFVFIPSISYIKKW